jgi:hypothetical protein
MSEDSDTASRDLLSLGFLDLVRDFAGMAPGTTMMVEVDRLLDLDPQYLEVVLKMIVMGTKMTPVSNRRTKYNTRHEWYRSFRLRKMITAYGFTTDILACQACTDLDIGSCTRTRLQPDG